MIHSGSRGCGHQVCSDYLRIMDKAYKNYKINIADRQLACAPLDSKEAQNYLKAMYAAANYAWANRQMMTHWIRETFEEVFDKSAKDMEMDIVYDVAHNIAKEENHQIYNRREDVNAIVHSEKDAIVAASKIGKTLKPLLDDFAQICGTKVKCADRDNCGKKIKGKNAVLLKDEGALCCGSVEGDAQAVDMIMSKSSLTLLSTKIFGKAKAINNANVIVTLY